MIFSQRATAIGALATTLVCGAAVLAPQAGAASRTEAAAKPVPKAAAAVVYNGVCGAGYGVVNSAPIGTAGTVFLTYNSKTGRNCVVTQRAKTGAKVYMVASIRLAPSGVPVTDAGNYTSYAGPVYLAAKGQCVSWSGTIGDSTAGKNGTNCAKLANALPGAAKN